MVLSTTDKGAGLVCGWSVHHVVLSTTDADKGAGLVYGWSVHHVILSTTDMGAGVSVRVEC